MTTLAASIAAINASARKVHGPDIYIMVARAVAFGNDDNMVLIQGRAHEAVARDFARTIKGAVITEETGGGFEGEPPYKYSGITWV